MWADLKWWPDVQTQKLNTPENTLSQEELLVEGQNKKDNEIKTRRYIKESIEMTALNTVLGYLEDVSKQNFNDEQYKILAKLFKGKNQWELEQYLQEIQKNSYSIEIKSLSTTQEFVSFIEKTLVDKSLSNFDKGKESIDISESLTLEQQIADFKAKGKALTFKEKRLLSKLNEQLIKKENNKQAEENNKQAEENDKQVIQDRIIKQLDSIRWSLWNTILKNKDYSSIKNLLNKAESEVDIGEKEKILTDVLKELKKDGKLLAIARDLIKKNWGGKNNKEYQNFRKAITSVAESSGDNSFEALFNNVEKELKIDDDVENREEKGDFVVSEVDGKRVITSTKWGEKTDRSFSVSMEEDEQFSSEKKAEIDEKYSNELLWISNTIAIVDTVWSVIEKMLSQGKNFISIKKQLLKSMDMYPQEVKDVINSSTTINQLKWWLVKVKDNLLKQKKQTDKKHKQELERFKIEKAKAYKEKDEKVKLMIHLMEFSWITLLGQWFLDNIFRMINWNPWLRASLWLARPIDLENGILGFSEQFSNIQRLIALWEMFNGMLTWDKNTPVDIWALQAGNIGFGNKKEAIKWSISKTLVTWTWKNYSLALENLEKSRNNKKGKNI